MAALIHTIRSVRAATFNDYIHMHLVPYLKSQIIPSAHDEVTLPSRHRIRNSSPGALRPSTLLLSHGGSNAPHNTYECSLRVSGEEIFVSLKPECQSGGRIRDLTTFQGEHFIATASAPRPNRSNWEYTNSKERLAKMSVKKTKIRGIISLALARCCLELILVVSSF